MVDLIISYTDRNTQQQLRLSCKQLHRLTTPRYFRSFRFRLSKLSLDGLIEIANNKTLAKYVQELEFNIHHLIWFFNFDHFVNELRLQPGIYTLPIIPHHS